MLHTDEIAQIAIFNNDYLQDDDNDFKNYTKEGVNKQHLYIINDKEIKENDYILYNIHCGYGLSDYNTYNNECIVTKYNKAVHPNIKYCKKIIATTDISLTSLQIDKEWITEEGIHKGKLKNGLPKISLEFISKFIKAYNEGNPITEVMVEYEQIPGKCHCGGICNDTCGDIDALKLKVNPKDNTITIKHCKESWNREEVKQLFNKGFEYLTLHTKEEFNNWIEQTL